MANRYFIAGQVFVANGTGVITEVGRHVANVTLNVTTEGNFTFTKSTSVGFPAVTVASGTATVTDSPVTLGVGDTTITVSGTGTIVMTITQGTATNMTSVNHWSATSGGVTGASVPGSGDNAYFDANSFPVTEVTATVDAALACLNMDWTGATNNPTFTIDSQLSNYGAITFIAAMVCNGTNYIAPSGAGNATITSNGLFINCVGIRPATTYSGTIILADALHANALTLRSGGFTTNGFTVDATSILCGTSGATTLTLGASTVNCTAWNCNANVTLTANTATINVSGTGAFAGGSITTYNVVNLNGTAHTISGSNTFATLNLGPSGAQTITWTDGTTQTFTNLTRTGTGVITFQGSAAAGYNLTKTGTDVVVLSDMSISRCTFSPAICFAHLSTNGGNNTGVVFNDPNTARKVLAGGMT